MGFPPAYHLSSDELPEFLEDAVFGQTVLRLRTQCRSGDRAWDILVARPFQHFTNSWFKWNAFRLHDRLVTRLSILSQLADRKSRTKNFYQSLFGAAPRDANEPEINFIAQIKSKPSS